VESYCDSPRSPRPEAEGRKVLGPRCLRREWTAAAGTLKRIRRDLGHSPGRKVCRAGGTPSGIVGDPQTPMTLGARAIESLGPRVIL
jgi:hypothetical protein